MSTARHSVSVAAAVIDDASRFLVIQRRDNGKWELPGGVLEVDEPILDGVKREVREETGYDIEPERLTGVYKNMKLGVVALVFRAHVLAGIPTRSSESINVEWWTPEMVTDRMTEAYSVRLLDALTPEGPAIREHDGTRLLEAGSNRLGDASVHTDCRLPAP